MLLISELIRQLREVQDANGDVPVVDEQDRMITNVEFSTEEQPDVVILISGEKI